MSLIVIHGRFDGFKVLINLEDQMTIFDSESGRTFLTDEAE